MSVVTDTIQATTGIASLVVAVLAWRESRLQRHTTGRPAGWRGRRPAGHDVKPRARRTLTPRGSRQSSRTEDPFPLAAPYAFLGAAFYYAVINSLLIEPVHRLIVGFVLLAAVIALLVYARFATTRPGALLGAITGGLTAASLVSVAIAILPASPPDEDWLAQSTMFVLVSLIWIVVAKIRGRSAS